MNLTQVINFTISFFFSITQTKLPPQTKKKSLKDLSSKEGWIYPKYHKEIKYLKKKKKIAPWFTKKTKQNEEEERK